LPNVPPPPAPLAPEGPKDAAAAALQAHADVEPAPELRTSSVPPPPPRRRPPESTIVVADQRLEQPPPQRASPADLPVIPRLDVPRVTHEAGDDSTKASTIPPAGRSTFIRSPSEVLAPRSTPAATPVPETSPWSVARDRVVRFARDARAKLPTSIRTQVEGISPPVLAGTAAMVVLILGAVASAIYGLATVPQSSELQASTPSAGPADSSVPASVPDATEPVARVPAAAPAAPSAPLDEATVLLDLAESMLAQRRDADAVPPLERLIARRPELKDHERLGRILLTAAASNDKQAAAKSYALLTGPMGETGAALLYELSLKSEVRDGVRERAEKWLASKEFERVAPLSVYAAVRLRKAASCEDKHALLEFAGKAGGKYVLSYLKELDGKKTCAPDNLEQCYPCLKSDERLAETIARLEKR
jgi:hypothetical protein